MKVRKFNLYKEPIINRIQGRRAMWSHTLTTVWVVFDVWRDACIRLDESACFLGRAEAVKPVLDLANNMRMVLVPGKDDFS